MKYIASCSFGKDSLAMVLLLLEREMTLDEVIFYNTGMEFDAIYNVRDKVVKMLQEKGIKYTELTPDKSFEWTMFERPVKHHNGTTSKGYSWCGGRCRWGTTQKNNIIKKYINENYEKWALCRAV